MREPREWFIFKMPQSNQALIRDPGEKWPSDIKGEPAPEWIEVIEKTPHVSKCLSMHDELVEELKIAVMNCHCSIAERDSGHLAHCRAPIWQDLLAKAEAE